MNQWLTETDLLEQYNISRDVLTATVWNGELRVYKQGDPFTAIDIPRKTKAQKEAECKKEFRGFGYPLDETLRGLDAVFSKMRYCFRGDLEGFEPTPEQVPKLISILEDAESTLVNRYEALKALLPVLRFRLADVKAWEVDQCLAPQTIEPQSPPEPQQDTAPAPTAPRAQKMVCLTPVQEDKWTAIAIADKYIRNCKDVPSIKKAVNIVKDKLNGQKPYTEKTIRGWIKNRFKDERSHKRGRPKKEQ